MLLVDIDVMIDYLRGHAAAVAFVKRHADRIALSAIVVAELYAGVRGDEERATLDELIGLFPIVPIDGQTACTGGLFKRDYGKSHGVGLADAMIAATAVEKQADLATLNVKHYPMLSDLKPAYRKR